MPYLPDRLPEKLRKRWEVPVAAGGMGGLSATAAEVFLGERDPGDALDVWRCLDAATGAEKWSYSRPAPAVAPGAKFQNLDFGNLPRATPVRADGRLHCLGAFGQLSCLDAATGEALWERDFQADFGLAEPTKWGVCATPLLADGKLLANPGGAEAGLAALDPATGKTLWTAPTKGYGYGSFVAATLGGVRQAVGCDAATFGGWDLATGRRLWTLAPARPNDFNVPTPVVADGALFLSSENNGTRRHRFRADGTPDPRPEATYDALAPDTHTPVHVGGRLLGAWQGLHCLDARTGLKLAWDADEPAAAGYATLVATATRALLVGLDGTLVLFDHRADRFAALGRAQAFENDQGVYAHPAFVGRRVYLRSSRTVACFEL